MFREPLGQSREVKVALSGLFGRFVARAYLERYFGLSLFAHLGRNAITLDGQLRLKIERTESRGDLPDWVCIKPNFTSLTVAEAKGCHDPAGADNALDRAWKQAHRINLVSRSGRLTIKRVAIASRWAAGNGGADKPILSVRDPQDDGDTIPPEEIEAASIGVARLHVANLLEPLGYYELARSLHNLVHATSAASARLAAGAAHRTLDTVRLHNITGKFESGPADALLGGIVTRAGPLVDFIVSVQEQEVLSRLDLRPVFIGIERRFVKTVIEGVGSLVPALGLSERNVTGDVRSDGAGGWTIRVGEGIAID